MQVARCAPALCGGKPTDLAAGIASHRLNFLAACLNETENPQNNRQSGECRLIGYRQVHQPERHLGNTAT
jgi:hypothetical protein